MAAAGSALAAAARVAFAGLISDGAGVLLFVPAVVGAAALGGFLPGIAAALLGAAALFLVNGGPAGIILFLLIGAALAVGGEWFQRSVERAVGDARRAQRARGASALDPRDRSRTR